MVKYALVRDGICINIIKWDGETLYTPPLGCTVIEDDGSAQIGQAYGGE